MLDFIVYDLKINRWMKIGISFLINIFGILMCLLLITIFGCKEKPPEEHYLTIQLKPAQIVNYTIELNYSNIKEGTLETTWNEIKLKNLGGIYTVYYWNSLNYKEYIEFNNNIVHMNHTISRELIVKKEKGTINITLDNSIDANALQDNYLRFTANGSINLNSYCIYRTIGIISVEPQLLKENIKPPEGYEVDACYQLKRAMHNENFSVPIKIHTMDYYDELDYIEIFAFDSDLSPKKRIGNKTWALTLNNEIGDVRLR